MEIWLIIAVICVIFFILFCVGWWLFHRRKVHIDQSELIQKSGKELYKTTSAFQFGSAPTKAIPQLSPPPTRVSSFSPYNASDTAVSIPRDAVHIPESSHPSVLFPEEQSNDEQATLLFTDFPDSTVVEDNSSAVVIEESQELLGDDDHTIGEDDHTINDVSGTSISRPITEEEIFTEAEDEIQAEEESTSGANLSEADIADDISEIDLKIENLQEDPSSRLVRLRERLAKTQSTLGKSMLGLIGGGDLDDESWEDLEDALISADIGVETAGNIVISLREKIAAQSVRTSSDAKKVITQVLVQELHPEWDRTIHALPHDDKPAVMLIVGVNGTGKTSTTGKLAKVLVSSGISVHLVAADTFRAAAADQLELWAQRAQATITRSEPGIDPSAVAFDGVTQALADNSNAVIVDTAGRLHNKVGLMDELAKIKRVVEKKAVVTEVLLVLDATIGQNGVIQAKTFAEIVNITGIVLTKLDGTAKGGIVYQVQNELGIPLKMVGLGEGADDLAPFDPEAFVHALLG